MQPPPFLGANTPPQTLALPLAVLQTAASAGVGISVAGPETDGFVPLTLQGGVLLPLAAADSNGQGKVLFLAHILAIPESAINFAASPVIVPGLNAGFKPLQEMFRGHPVVVLQVKDDLVSAEISRVPPPIERE